MVLIIGLTIWAIEARIIRGQALSLRNRDFILSARVAGESTLADHVRRVRAQHDQPDRAGFVLVFSIAILTDAGLEFLGFGDMNNASWGMTLYWAQNNSSLLQGEWWPFLFPGVALALTIARSSSSSPGRRGERSAASAEDATDRRLLMPFFRPRSVAPERRDRAAGAAVQRPGGEARALVELRELVVDYVLAGRRMRAVDHVNLADPRRRDRRPSGRVGLRQEHGRERDHAAAAPSRSA